MENPSAFPVPMLLDGEFTGDVNQQGMTLLDYFAGKVLIRIPNEIKKTSDDNIARHCYTMAEAMLKEREKRIKP